MGYQSWYDAGYTSLIDCQEKNCHSHSVEYSISHDTFTDMGVQADYTNDGHIAIVTAVTDTIVLDICSHQGQCILHWTHQVPGIKSAPRFINRQGTQDSQIFLYLSDSFSIGICPQPGCQVCEPGGEDGNPTAPHKKPQSHNPGAIIAIFVILFVLALAGEVGMYLYKKGYFVRHTFVKVPESQEMDSFDYQY